MMRTGPVPFLGSRSLGRPRDNDFRVRRSRGLSAFTQLICPSGCVDEFLSSLYGKNIPLVPSGKSAPLIPPSRAHLRGVTRRHERGARDAMDGATQLTSAFASGRRSRVVPVPPI